MTVPMRLRCRSAALLVLALALAPAPAQAEHPVGSPAWLRARQGDGETASRAAAADAPIAGSGRGTSVQPPPTGIDQGTSAETEGTGRSAAAAVSLNPLSLMALGELKAFKGRPLFAPSRRPPFSEPVAVQPVAIEEPVVAGSPAPDLRLIGIVAGAEKAVAVLGRAGGGPPISVRVGDQIETWKVQLIAPDRVVLRQGEREQSYRLFAAAAGAVQAPSQARRSGAPSLPRLSTARPEPDL